MVWTAIESVKEGRWWLPLVMVARLPLAMILALTACDKTAGDALCGFNAVAGSTILLNQFSVPNSTLATPPATLPEKLVVRLVAGPAYRGLSGKVGESWVIGMEGDLPPNIHPAFGVLILDKSSKARGVVLFESPPVKGAPPIGTVSIGSASVVPLLGLEIDPTAFEDAHCPFFPDSVLQ
jgi:hypothetical protein